MNAAHDLGYFVLYGLGYAVAHYLVPIWLVLFCGAVALFAIDAFNRFIGRE